VAEESNAVERIEGCGNEVTSGVVAISVGEGIGEESGDVGRRLGNAGDGAGSRGGGGGSRGRRGVTTTGKVLGKVGGGRGVFEILEPLLASTAFGGSVGVPANLVAVVGAVTVVPSDAGVKAGFTDSESGRAGFVADAGVFGKRRQGGGRRAVTSVGGGGGGLGSGVAGRGARSGGVGGGPGLDGRHHGDDILFDSGGFPVNWEVLVVGEFDSLENSGVH
jgi:hypothetical protein